MMEETVEPVAGAAACNAEDGLGLRQIASTKRSICFCCSSFPQSIFLNS